MVDGASHPGHNGSVASLGSKTRQLISQRLADEKGRIDKQAPLRVALAYPSPYRVAMSSLGYQSVYRELMAHPEAMCERVFLPDGGDKAGAEIELPVTYESLRPISDFPIVAFSVAYELELAGLVKMLEVSGLRALREERDERDPFVLAGGPLTFSNPTPLLAFADAVVMGEAEGITEWAVKTICDSPNRAEALTRLAKHPSISVPSEHGERLGKIAACDNDLLPAYSAIRTPHTELSNMFLIETERGCSRSCQYCVMRRSTNGGMRLVTQGADSRADSRRCEEGRVGWERRSAIIRESWIFSTPWRIRGARWACRACAPIACARSSWKPWRGSAIAP